MLAFNRKINTKELDKTISEKLNHRLSNSTDYSITEIEKVSSLNASLFPKNFTLSKDSTEQFRKLASFSQIELKPARTISSHRKLIGPLIVFVKKLSWPLVSIHLKEPFQGIREFCNTALVELAKKENEINELRKKEL